MASRSREKNNGYAIEKMEQIFTCEDVDQCEIETHENYS
jgi:hypothetical protein